MTKALQKSVRSFGFLFALNWDSILFFSATALAMAGWAYLILM
ncbi:hypothetical protein [Ruegeria meonggei]|uniref:Uncharacterized protein n=1 Tax=Ruegeria meonggei TaxID=1446476 RepID=A0A1X7A518_9RHOB|nr:hypothetical protein [Ruegeria meonggei]SLN70803.1 hypothetical protein RUM8411_03637 [Ruegeria meonggei]